VSSVPLKENEKYYRPLKAGRTAIVTATARGTKKQFSRKG
jgi:hypothetical protein